VQLGCRVAVKVDIGCRKALAVPLLQIRHEFPGVLGSREARETASGSFVPDSHRNPSREVAVCEVRILSTGCQVIRIDHQLRMDDTGCVTSGACFGADTEHAEQSIRLVQQFPAM
jgi:hypothetical protein